ncbi:glutamate receptor ionotropic, kainate 1-like [Diachasma alloeum]|uniref:Ionotropic receptor 101 n=1 Tax=Diachasma alloeum TaxID=454923 RepID=A0A4E0RYY1_9HYME|nr:glutamate receptor ionotropic, kainate 1-like [Diachasma alloeum]THK33021.1 ionotropic receptor 101 [Diachasma alloeum]
MKFSIPLIFFITFILAFFKLNGAHYHGPLLKAVHSKYKTNGGIIVSGTGHMSFGRTTIWHEAVRMLSNDGIFTVIVNLRQFGDKLKSYSGGRMSLLIVIAIDTVEELHSFESMSKDFHLSYAVWLILFSRDASQDVCDFCRNPHDSLSNLGFGSKVLVSCCDSDMIEEWWSIGENRIERQELGRLMDDNQGILWLSEELVNRRRYSLNGQELRIVTVQDSFSFQEKNGTYYGFLGEILKELREAMNFTVSIIYEEGYGALNLKTGNYTGYIGRIHRREADLGVAQYFIRKELLHVLSYTSPVLSGYFEFHFRKPDAVNVPWNVYLKVFTGHVWMAILSLILTSTLLLTLITYRRRSHFVPLLFENHLIVWDIYCQQALPAFPDKTPLRIVYISLALSALVTLSAYSASIISQLAVFSYSPFRTPEEFVEDGSYKIIRLRNTPSHSTVMDYELSDEKLMKKFESLLQLRDLNPRNPQEAFEQICRERVAFLAFETAKTAVNNEIPCEITSFKFGPVYHVAMLMPLGSSYMDLINHHIQQFKDNGILRRLKRKYSTVPRGNKSALAPVEIHEIAPILFMLAFAFLIAFIIFISEMNYDPFTKELHKPRRRKTRKRRAKAGHFHLRHRI